MSENFTSTTDIAPVRAETPEEARAILEAMETVRSLDPVNFDRLRLCIDALANALTPDFRLITPQTYFELLFCLARCSQYCAPMRQELDAENLRLLEATEQERRQKQFETFTAAVAAVRQRHHDVDRWLDLMDEVAKGLTRNPCELSPSGYVEALYLAAKISAFAEPLRAQFLQKAAPEGGAYRM